ncbi:hypothetical protein HWV23_11220 [Natronomonas halophila]|uniref:hypothetical protein n=1 Tax=Natronomonas halophila TaxID=2747817 RepID=UPI0015B4848B|nr:hypothetical protein [Natronomonas halophila]QLD86268.1 hypothetical protein HWV23_11220 [Natronomonas halophila]
MTVIPKTMGRYCDACGTRIHSPESQKVCMEPHDRTETYESVVVHIACPCPDHGWDGDFAYPGQE